MKRLFLYLFISILIGSCANKSKVIRAKFGDGDDAVNKVKVKRSRAKF